MGNRRVSETARSGCARRAPSVACRWRQARKPQCRTKRSRDGRSSGRSSRRSEFLRWRSSRSAFALRRRTEALGKRCAASAVNGSDRLGTGIWNRIAFDEAAMTITQRGSRGHPNGGPHGGDVWEVAQEFGIPAEEILDFSANINPRGLPERARRRLESDAANRHLLSLYPDPSARCLRQALSAKLDVSAESIVVGPGAEGLLAPVLRSSVAKRGLVPIPAFSEYRRVCEQQHVEYVPFPREELRTHIRMERGDVLFLNNPHNPSGSMMEAREVRGIFEMARSAGATLLVRSEEH